jgi:hypothetical protein
VIKPLHVTRAGGLLVGIAAAVALLVASRPAADLTAAPASVRISVPPTGEIEATPTAPKAALEAAAIRPGDGGRTGSFAIRNQTGTGLAITFAAEGGSSELDGLIRIRMSAGELLADTTLQGIRKGTATPLVLPSGAERRIRVHVWLPGSISSGYEGRRVELSLAPKTEAVR